MNWTWKTQTIPPNMLSRTPQRTERKKTTHLPSIHQLEQVKKRKKPGCCKQELVTLSLNRRSPAPDFHSVPHTCSGEHYQLFTNAEGGTGFVIWSKFWGLQILYSLKHWWTMILSASFMFSFRKAFFSALFKKRWMLVLISLDWLRKILCPFVVIKIALIGWKKILCTFEAQIYQITTNAHQQ